MHKTWHSERLRVTWSERGLLSYYGGLLLAFMTIWIIALGGGIWRQATPWHLQWQSLLFGQLCHQLPARSFWVAGQPMAVCIRCFGIYSGLLFGWATLPWWNGVYNYTRHFAIVSILTALFINIGDAGIDFFMLEQHFHTDRWIYGALLGIAVVLILNLKSNTNKND